jgi:hypothetical protein
LLSTVERLTFLNDPRLEANVLQSGRVELRRGQVNAQVKKYLQKQGWEMLPASHKDARLACHSILGRHFASETRAFALEECARKGIAPESPSYNRAPYLDKFDAIQDAVGLGLIEAPTTPETQALLQAKPHELTDIVARDVTVQEDRCTELRHPLVLRGWLAALEHLRDRHCELAGLEPLFTLSLPRLDMERLRILPPEEARKHLNRRRFIRGLAQRYRECQMHSRQLVRAVNTRRADIDSPWKDAWAEARAEVARAHPQEFQALLAAFEPFCVPGSTGIRPELLTGGGRIAGQLIPTLKKALADGTWVRLIS